MLFCSRRRSLFASKVSIMFCMFGVRFFLHHRARCSPAWKETTDTRVLERDVIDDADPVVFWPNAYSKSVASRSAMLQLIGAVATVCRADGDCDRHNSTSHFPDCYIGQRFGPGFVSFDECVGAGSFACAVGSSSACSADVCGGGHSHAECACVGCQLRGDTVAARTEHSYTCGCEADGCSCNAEASADQKLIAGAVERRRRVAAATCEELVPSTVDVSPMRSPQTLHTAMLPTLNNKDVVEIGTRNGDGISCFSQVASKATAVEMDAAYCLKLEARAQSLRASGRRGFDVLCRDYREGSVHTWSAWASADVYTWWQEPPELSNLPVLRRLKMQLDAGWLKRDVLALIAIDPKYPEDATDLRLLEHELQLTSSVETVVHNELHACQRSSDKDLRAYPGLCGRAHGHFRLAHVPVASVNVSSLERAYCRWVNRKEEFCAHHGHGSVDL